MADARTTELAATTSLEDADLIAVVDVSDTSMAATGTNKKITKANLLADLSVGESAAGILGLYRADAVTVGGDPAAGHLRWNDATQVAATILTVDHLTTQSFDLDNLFAFIAEGDTLLIQDKNNSENWQTWEVSGAPSGSHAATYWSFPVTFVDSNGTGTTGFANNALLFLATRTAGAIGLPDIIAPDTVGSASLVPVLTLDAKGRVTGYDEATLSLPRYGALDLMSHSYGFTAPNDGATNPVDTFGNFLNRVAAVSQVPENEILVLGKSGGMGASPSRGTSTDVQGIGEYLRNIWPDHVFSGAGLPRQGSKARPGLGIICLGINDPVREPADGSALVLNTYEHHMRSMVARRRARAIYLYNDPLITYTGTWSDVTNADATRGTVKRTSTNTDYAEFAIPESFLGGHIDLVVWANANGITTITEDLDTSELGVDVTERGAFPQGTDDFVIQIDSEQMLVTSGNGTGAGTFTIDASGRGYNGTTAATHTSGAFVRRPTTTALLTLSGAASGTHSIAGQGCGYAAGGVYGGRRACMTIRVSLTGAAAGTTLRATVSQLVTGETFDVDSILFEDEDPPTVLLVNQPMMSYGSTAAFFTPDAHAGGAIGSTYNAALADVAAEFDSSVQVVDVATVFKNLFGATIQTATGTGTTIVITPHLASANLIAKGSILRCESEELLVTSAVTKTSDTEWSMTVTRAYAGVDAGSTGASTNHAVGRDIFDTAPWNLDRIHQSEIGAMLYTATIMSTIGEAPQSNNQIGAAGGYTRARQPTIKDGMELHVANSTRVTSSSANLSGVNTLHCSRIYIPQHCVIRQFACEIVTTAASGGAGGVARMGLWTDYKGRPGALVVEADPAAPVSTTTTGIKTIACFKQVQPGWYWVGVVQQSCTTIGSMRAAAGVKYGAFGAIMYQSASSILGAANDDINGVYYSSVTGALTQILGIAESGVQTGVNAGAGTPLVTLLVDTQVR